MSTGRPGGSRSRGSRASDIDWGTLLLFGGGLSLGAAMFRTGLAAALGHGLTRVSGANSEAALLVLFTAIAVYLTEVTSNTATATMLVPAGDCRGASGGGRPHAPGPWGVPWGAAWRSCCR
ncbi:MAG: SLC13 family permease [Thermoanaerobaculaceae bacterium]